MIDVEEARKLLGKRVTIVYAAFRGTGQVDGFLRGVPDESTVWWQSEEPRAHETRLTGVIEVIHQPLICSRCHGEANRLFEGMCADCHRPIAQARSARRPSVCQGCGKAGAFRNPADPLERYLCTSCHANTGVAMGASLAVTEMTSQPCYAADTDDPRHRWKRIRGSRFGCRCGASRFGEPR